MTYEDTTSYYDDGSEYGAALSSTTASKTTQLQDKKQDKITRLAPQDVQTGVLLGMEDADGALHINNYENDTRLSPLDGQRYDAVEIKHGDNPYDMLGKTKEQRDAGMFGKSTYSMQKQREQVANIVGKTADTVTEQDMVDVGNWQQIQSLSDIANADEIAAGGERWQAPFIQNVEQTNLTGRYENEYGEKVNIPLDVPISYVANGSTGNKGRQLAAIMDSAGKVDITGLAAKDKLLNAFASNKPRKEIPGGNSELAAIRARFAKYGEPVDDGADNSYLENTYNLAARSFGIEGAKIGDAVMDMAIGDDALVSKETAKEWFGEDNVADNGFDFTGLDKYKKESAYDSVDATRLDNAQKSTAKFVKDKSIGNFIGMAIDNVSALDQQLIQSAPEMAEMALTTATFGTSLGVLVTKKNNEILEDRLRAKIKATGNPDAKLSDDDYLVSVTASAAYGTLGMLTQGGLAFAKKNSAVSNVLIKPLASSLAKIVSNIPGKSGKIFAEALKYLATGTVAYGAEGLDEYGQTFAEQFGKEAKTLGAKEFERIYSDEKLATERLEALFTAGFMGVGMKVGGDVYRGVKDSIDNLPVAADTTEVDTALADSKYNDLQKFDSLDKEIITEAVNALSPEELQAVFEAKISDEDINSHMKSIADGGEGVLAPFEEAIVERMYTDAIANTEAQLDSTNEQKAAIESNEQLLLSGTVAKEDGTAYTEEEVQVALKELADSKVILEANSKAYEDMLVEYGNKIEPIVNRTAAVYNNRPLEEIANDIAKLDKAEATPETEVKRKLLLVEKMLAESKVVELADKGGVAVGKDVQVRDRDTQTMKVYGGFDSGGNYYKGLYQYASGLLNGSMSAKFGLKKFMRSQEQKLEKAKQLKEQWKEGDGTIEAVYGVDKKGNDVIFKYHGPQSNKSIQQIEDEVRLFQEVYDTIVNDTFATENKQEEKYVPKWYERTYNSKAAKAVSVITRLLNGELDMDAMSENKQNEMKQFLANNKQLVEEVASKLKKGNIDDSKRERTDGTEEGVDKAESTRTETEEVTREEELLQAVAGLARDVGLLSEEIVTFGNKSAVVQGYLDTVDNVLAKYEELYSVLDTKTKGKLTRTINSMLKDTGSTKTVKRGKIAESVILPTVVEEVASPPIEETIITADTEQAVEDVTVPSTSEDSEDSAEAYQEEMVQIQGKIDLLGDTFVFDDTNPKSEYFGLSNKEKLDILDKKIKETNRRSNPLLDSGNKELLVSVAELLKASGEEVMTIVKNTLGCK